VPKEFAMSIPKPAAAVAALACALVLASTACAQRPITSASNPLDVVPEREPFDIPYGVPISLQRAQAIIASAIAEATRRGWPMNVAVVDSGASLVAFARMDTAQLASVAVSQHKARTAVMYRRPTKVFEDGIQQSGYLYQLTLDDVIASRGGFPIIENGTIIGGLGCSGGSGSQDEIVCRTALTGYGR
jgi:glc operon protein GlcG